MIPREKANDLVSRYYYMLPNNGLIDTGINSCDSRYKEAIECAFVAVNEIIDTLNYDIRDLDVRGNILLDLIKFITVLCINSFMISIMILYHLKKQKLIFTFPKTD